MPEVNLIEVVLHSLAFPFDIIKGTLGGGGGGGGGGGVKIS
jgi:hypothetical protein